MIRFNCPNCNRYYELSPALALLPLLCKQCGQGITPPPGDPEPPPPPKPAPAPPKDAPPAPPSPKAAARPAPPVIAPGKPPVPTPSSPPEDEDGDILITKPGDAPGTDFSAGGAPSAGLSDPARPRPAGLDGISGAAAPTGAAPDAGINLELLGPAPPRRPRAPGPPEPEPEPPPETRAEPTLVPFMADVIAFVALVVIGMFIGELLGHKPTGEVLSEAGSAPTFPPLDLLVWGGPPLTLALLYLLLNGRQLSVGAWLRRRAAR